MVNALHNSLPVWPPSASMISMSPLALAPVLSSRFFALRPEDELVRKAAIANRKQHRRIWGPLCLASAMHAKVYPNFKLAKALRAARGMLRERIVEESDNEVKIDAIVLAAAALSMSGVPVHVVTLSADRAALIHERASVTLSRLGISFSELRDEADFDQRLAGYQSRVVFASAARLAQDVMRDVIGLGDKRTGQRAAVGRLARRQGDFAPMLPHHRFALVDDADLIMLEAPRPVRLSEELEVVVGRTYADQAFAIISSLERDHHYAIDAATARVRLTSEGQQRLETFAMLFGGAWADAQWREDTVFAAITIRDLFTPGIDYEIDHGMVLLTRSAISSEVVPSITDLVSAKEQLPYQRSATHLWDTRKLFGSYAQLGGVGVGLVRLKADFETCFGCKVTLAGASPHVPIPSVFSDRRSLLLALANDLLFQRDVLVWAPFPSDAADLPASIADRRILLGDEIFATRREVSAIVQTGAAHRNWESRLLLYWPKATISSYASPDDGLFKSLDRDEAEFRAFVISPNLDTFNAAREKRETADSDRRQAQARSDAYFEKITGFLGSPV